MLTTPIAITNTHSVGVVRDALGRHAVGRRRPATRTGRCRSSARRRTACSTTSTASTCRREHLDAALDAARGGPGRRGQRRRRDRDDLPRVQGRDRDGVAGRRDAASAATRSACWSRRTTASATGCGSTACRSATAIRLDEVPSPYRPETTMGAAAPQVAAAARARARSSSWSRPTRRSCPTSASGSPSAPGSGSRGPAGPAATRSGDLFIAFATGNRPLPLDDDGGRPAARRSTSDRSATRHRRAVRRRHRGRPRRRSSTRWSPPRR